MIEIDPNNSNNIYVAAYGPLWKEGEKEDYIFLKWGKIGINFKNR